MASPAPDPAGFRSGYCRNPERSAESADGIPRLDPITADPQGRPHSMSAPEDTITQLAVRELAAAGAVREAVLVPDPQVPDAWLLRVRTGTLERTLRMRDEARARSFASSDAAVRLARKLGIRALLVDLAAPVAVARRRLGRR